MNEKMRTRKEIEDDADCYERDDLADWRIFVQTKVMLEVLLDIRDLLSTNSSKS